MGRRTKALAPTLLPGDIAVIDHPDLDTVAAESLAVRRPGAVVNCAPFTTGRYPNRGPRVLLDAGIPLFEADGVGIDAFVEGHRLQVHANGLQDAGIGILPQVRRVLSAEMDQRIAAARENMVVELDRFARNTLEFLGKETERALLLDTVALPPVHAKIAGRHVLIAVRGDGFARDLQRLRSYLKDVRPVVIAVDGAADQCLSLGISPDIVMGDMDSVSDRALILAKEIVVHGYPVGPGEPARAPGAERVRGLGLRHVVFAVPGTSEDAAMLLAHESGADLIVAVGTHSNLEDFLDKGRGGMASTFLVRMKVGSRLVDARGVSRLYGESRSVGSLIIWVLLAAAFPVVVLLGGTPFGQMVSRALIVWFRARFA